MIDIFWQETFRMACDEFLGLILRHDVLLAAFSAMMDF